MKTKYYRKTLGKEQPKIFFLLRLLSTTLKMKLYGYSMIFQFCQSFHFVSNLAYNLLYYTTFLGFEKCCPLCYLDSF